MPDDARTVLHVLAQRPMLTGSGVTLDALVREAGRAGWGQHVVCGLPADVAGAVGEIPAANIHPLRFGTAALPFPVAGMSDVMPYESSRFRDMDDAVWRQYREAWRAHLTDVVRRVHPQVIHTHHLWLVSSLLPEIAPRIPVVAHCHATGLRQMVLCPDRAEEVREGLRGCARFVVLHEQHRADLVATLGVPGDRVHVVGAGYREEVFHRADAAANVPRQPSVLYAGKLAAAKGVAELCDAFTGVRARVPEAHLIIASGDAAGDPEASALSARIDALGAGRVVRYGRLQPEELAALFCRAQVVALPSFYEGLPLLLVEAAACGANLVATALPGVVDVLAPALGPILRTVAMPELRSVDEIAATARPAFVAELENALVDALRASPPASAKRALQSFTWRAVFTRVEAVWREVVADAAG